MSSATPASFALLAAAALAACGGSTDRQADGGPTPTVTMVGDTALLELPVGRSADNGEISVTFDAVTEDSRCPRGVQCVWQGNASVRLTLESGDDVQVVILGSALEPRQASFAGYTVGLRGLAPDPASDGPLDGAPYVARIAVVDAR
jgi:hypothetical protein